MIRDFRLLQVVALSVILCGITVSPSRGEEVQSPLPRIWLFMGLPGDAERSQRYLETVTAICGNLQDRFGVPSSQIRVLFGSGSPSPYGACNRSALLRELERVRKALAEGNPVWVFFFGHANTRGTDAVFNITGADVTASEIGEALGTSGRTGTGVFWFTTSASGRFLHPSRGAGRILVAAGPPGGVDNETEFPHALAQVLRAPEQADANADGILSVPELVTAVRREVDRFYAANGWLRAECAVLDGDGDGQASADPAGTDWRLAEGAGLRYPGVTAAP